MTKNMTNLRLPWTSPHIFQNILISNSCLASFLCLLQGGIIRPSAIYPWHIYIHILLRRAITLILYVILRTLATTTMSFHMPIARAHLVVARGPWRHAVAPAATCIACPYAHLMSRCLATPVITLALAICIYTNTIINHYNMVSLCIFSVIMSEDQLPRQPHRYW